MPVSGAMCNTPGVEREYEWIRALMAGTLADAFYTLKAGCVAGADGRAVLNARYALAWIQSNADDDPLDFVYICDALELDVRRWRQKASEIIANADGAWPLH